MLSLRLPPYLTCHLPRSQELGNRLEKAIDKSTDKICGTLVTSMDALDVSLKAHQTAQDVSLKAYLAGVVQVLTEITQRPSSSVQLRELRTMLHDGEISQEEYQAKKTQILASL